MKKEILFAAKFDNQAFNTQMKEMQTRVMQVAGSINAAMNQGAMADRMKALGMQVPGAPGAMQRDQTYRQSAKELESIMRDQWKQAREINKELDQRLKKAKELRKEEEALLKMGKDATTITQRRGEVEAEIRKKEAEHMLRMQQLEEVTKQREKLEDAKPSGWNRIKTAFMGAYGGNPGGGLASIASGMGGAGTAAYRMMGGGVGLGIGAAGMLATGLQMADPIVRSVSAQDRIMAGAQGSAVQGLSSPIRDIYGGNLRSSLYFGNERATAMGRAMQETQTNRTMDQISPWSGLGAKTAAGASAGFVGGAILGGGVFSGLTAAGGAAIGGAGGFLKGAYDIAADAHQRDTVLAQFGSASARKRLEAKYNADLAGRMNENLEAEKAKNPLKTLAEGQYSAGLEGNLAMQRQLGYNNNDYYGKEGFLDRGMEAGFTRQQMTGTASDIISAGGSTRAARESSVFSNQLQRADITNASSIIGKLSGNMGSAAVTEQATIKVLSEGVKLGLDKSEFREEQRKFADMTASAVQASGATTVTGASRAAQEFGSYFNGGQGQPTMGDMSGAQTAKGVMDTATSQTGNARGAIFAAKVMSSPTLSKLDAQQKSVLSQLPLSSLTEDNPMVADMAQKAGVDVSTFVTEAKNAKLGSVNVTQKSEKSLQAIRNMTDEQRANMTPAQIGSVLNNLGAEDSSIVQNMGSSPQAQRAFLNRLAKGETTPEQVNANDLNAEGIALRGTNTQGTGRMEDTDMAAVAKQQQIVNDQFLEMKGAMEQAATAAQNMTAQAMAMAITLNQAITSGKPITADQVKQQMDFYKNQGSTTAPRSGKSR